MSLREQVVTRHAIRRASERYSLDMDPDQLRDIQAVIRANDPRAVLLAPCRDDCRLVAVHHAERWLACIADERSTIVTFLPPARLAEYLAFLDGIDPETGKPWPEPATVISAVPDAVILYRPDPGYVPGFADSETPPVGGLLSPAEIDRMGAPISDRAEDILAAVGRLRAAIGATKGIPGRKAIVHRIMAVLEPLERRLKGRRAWATAWKVD